MVGPSGNRGSGAAVGWRALRMGGVVLAGVVIFGPLSSLVIWSFAEKWY